MTESILIGCINLKTASHTGMLVYLLLLSRLKMDEWIMHELVQIDKEKVHWRAMLKRVVAVVKFLCERGLPLSGGNEVFGSSQNGNFLGLLELLAQFDNFLADHIRRFGNSGKGVPSYLSSTICNEFVQLMAKEVTTKIANEVKKVGFCSITVNSTPDVTHVDQLTFIIRYVQDDGTIVERFLKFI